LMSAGAEKSGKPCERLTAPYFIASRVISRITDSVNELALRDTWRRLEVIGVVMALDEGTTLPNFATDEHRSHGLVLFLIGVIRVIRGRNLRNEYVAGGFAF
jgi:hypothetical protein